MSSAVQARSDFWDHIDNLSVAKCNRFLIAKSDGDVGETHVVRFIFEHIKGFVGFDNHCDQSLVGLRVMQLIGKGIHAGYFDNGTAQGEETSFGIQKLAIRARLITDRLNIEESNTKASEQPDAENTSDHVKTTQLPDAEKISHAKTADKPKRMANRAAFDKKIAQFIVDHFEKLSRYPFAIKTEQIDFNRIRIIFLPPPYDLLLECAQSKKNADQIRLFIAKHAFLLNEKNNKEEPDWAVREKAAEAIQNPDLKARTLGDISTMRCQKKSEETVDAEQNASTKKGWSTPTRADTVCPSPKIECKAPSGDASHQMRCADQMEALSYEGRKEADQIRLNIVKTTPFASFRDTASNAIKDSNVKLEALKFIAKTYEKEQAQEILKIADKMELLSSSGRIEADQIRLDIVKTTPFASFRDTALNAIKDSNVKLEALRFIAKTYTEKEQAQEILKIADKMELLSSSGRIEADQIRLDIVKTTPFTSFRDTASNAIKNATVKLEALKFIANI